MPAGRRGRSRGRGRGSACTKTNRMAQRDIEARRGKPGKLPPQTSQPKKALAQEEDKLLASPCSSSNSSESESDTDWDATPARNTRKSLRSANARRPRFEPPSKGAARPSQSSVGKAGTAERATRRRVWEPPSKANTSSRAKARPATTASSSQLSAKSLRATTASTWAPPTRKARSANSKAESLSPVAAEPPALNLASPSKTPIKQSRSATPASRRTTVRQDPLDSSRKTAAAPPPRRRAPRGKSATAAAQDVLDSIDTEPRVFNHSERTFCAHQCFMNQDLLFPSWFAIDESSIEKYLEPFKFYLQEGAYEQVADIVLNEKRKMTIPEVARLFQKLSPQVLADSFYNKRVRKSGQSFYRGICTTQERREIRNQIRAAYQSGEPLDAVEVFYALYYHVYKRIVNAGIINFDEERFMRRMAQDGFRDLPKNNDNRTIRRTLTSKAPQGTVHPSCITWDWDVSKLDALYEKGFPFPAQRVKEITDVLAECSISFDAADIIDKHRVFEIFVIELNIPGEKREVASPLVLPPRNRASSISRRLKFSLEQDNDSSEQGTSSSMASPRPPLHEQHLGATFICLVDVSGTRSVPLIIHHQGSETPDTESRREVEMSSTCIDAQTLGTINRAYLTATGSDESALHQVVGVGGLTPRHLHDYLGCWRGYMAKEHDLAQDVPVVVFLNEKCTSFNENTLQVCSNLSIRPCLAKDATMLCRSHLEEAFSEVSTRLSKAHAELLIASQEAGCSPSISDIDTCLIDAFYSQPLVPTDCPQVGARELTMKEIKDKMAMIDRARHPELLSPPSTQGVLEEITDDMLLPPLIPELAW